MKKRWIILLCFFCFFTLNGCVKKFDRKDVEKFLREMDTLKVSRIVEGPVEKESESGYKDEF